jgi:hypothetical protein
MDMDHGDQVLHTWEEKKKEENKIGSRKRYTIRAILVWTHDTIEGVSHLGSIAVLLKGEFRQNYGCQVPLGDVDHAYALGPSVLTSNPCKSFENMLTHVHMEYTHCIWQVGSKGEEKRRRKGYCTVTRRYSRSDRTRPII